ncbi:MAG TPA: hypothetical protein VED87_11715 [Methylocystis sp.]|nr:hypothetical protein [Methylocystis sp.]
MQFNGSGAPRDVESAVKLLREAARRGNAVAQNRLAYVLAQGKGVEHDLAEAAKMRDLARAKGLKDDALDRLLDDLTKEQSRNAKGR